MFKMMHDETAIIQLMATRTPMRWIRINQRLWLIELRRGWALVGLDTYDALSVLSFARVVITDELEAVKLFIKNHWLITNAYAPYLPGGGALEGANWKKIGKEIAKYYKEEETVPARVLLANSKRGYWLMNGSAREFLVSSVTSAFVSAIEGDKLDELISAYCLSFPKSREINSPKRTMRKRVFPRISGIKLSDYEKRILEAYKRVRARTVGRYERVITDKITEAIMAKVLARVTKLPIIDNGGVMMTHRTIEQLARVYEPLSNCALPTYVTAYEPPPSAYLLERFEGVTKPLRGPDTDFVPIDECPQGIGNVAVCIPEAARIVMNGIIKDLLTRA